MRPPPLVWHRPLLQAVQEGRGALGMGRPAAWPPIFCYVRRTIARSYHTDDVSAQQENAMQAPPPWVRR